MLPDDVLVPVANLPFVRRYRKGKKKTYYGEWEAKWPWGADGAAQDCPRLLVIHWSESISISIYFHISIHFYRLPSIYIYFHLFSSIRLHPFHPFPSTSIYVHLCTSMSIYFLLFPSISIYICSSISIYVPFSISIYPSISIYIIFSSISIYVHLFLLFPSIYSLRPKTSIWWPCIADQRSSKNN